MPARKTLTISQNPCCELAYLPKRLINKETRSRDGVMRSRCLTARFPHRNQD